MTRKKYVKYLMGQGLPRNKAVLFAAALRGYKIPYKYCEVGDVRKCSNGMYMGSCLIPRKIIQMARHRDASKVDVEFGKCDAKLQFYETDIPLQRADRLTELQIGLSAEPPEGWQDPPLTKWLRSNDFPVSKAYSTNEYRPMPRLDLKFGS